MQQELALEDTRHDPSRSGRVRMPFRIRLLWRLLGTGVTAVLRGASWVVYWRWIGIRQRLRPTHRVMPDAAPHPTAGAGCVGPLKGENDGDSHFLTRTEADGFAADGYLAPFPLMSPDEAACLLAEMRREITPHRLLIGHEVREFFGQGRFDKRVARGGLQGFHGHWQHLRLKSLADLLRQPELNQRLASILGEDLICWRSQFFECMPGSAGTAWHQASTFREGARRPKLEPTVELGNRPIQLTAWIALTDTTVENGCLRILRGSHLDSYLVDREADLADDLVGSVAEYAGRLSLRKQCALAKILASPSPFAKSKFLIDNIVLKERPGFFDEFEAVDLEMKAGEAVIFTSLAVHGSHANRTGSSRVGFAGRFTTNDVLVFGGRDYDYSPPVFGKEFRLSLDSVGPVQVWGEDRYGINDLRTMPE